MAEGSIDTSIEQTIDQKVKPLIDSAMHQYLGVTVDEIRTDITDRLKNAPFFEFNLHADKTFKKAKELLRAEFLTRILRRHFGNVSMASKIAGLDRRSLHRLIERHHIDVDRFREEMTKRSYLKETAITNLISKTLDTYKPILNKERMDNLYSSLPDLSRHLVEVLPDRELTLDEAEAEWERRYLLHHLERNHWNISATARAVGIRYETLHRKIKSLRLADSQARIPKV